MTAQDVFEIAMTLIDETPENGIFDADRTADYQNKTPYILTRLQSEICRDANLFKTVDITASGTEGYVQVTLPDDFRNIHQLYDTNLEVFNNFKYVGNDIYVPFDFSGIMVYKYIPTKILHLTDSVSVNNEIASTVLADGLASALIVSENATLSDFLNQKYEEGKRNLRDKEVSSVGTIKDVYDCSLSY